MIKCSWFIVIAIVGGVIASTALALALLASPPARTAEAACAATITVQNANDSGPGSLRQALADLCPGGVITFAADETIFLHSPLGLNSRLMIDGSGHAITVSGDTGNDGSGDVQVFNVGASGVVTLLHLNIISGTVTIIISGTMPYLAPGGGVYVSAGGRLTVADCAFTGNSARGAGGGLYNAGVLTVLNSTFSGNSAVYGSGLYNDGVLNLQGSLFISNTTGIAGSLYSAAASTVQSSTFSGNSGIQGSALYNTGTLTLKASFVYNNSAPNDAGGGLYNSGALTVQTSAIVSNSARYGGGLYNSGSLTVTKSTFSGNAAGSSGGGIENEGNLRVVSSLFSGNSAGSGGGLANSGPSSVESSTFSDNSAEGGGGLYSQGDLAVTACTFAGNLASQLGGGLMNGGSPLIMLNSTVYSNSAQIGGGIISFGAFTATNSTLAGNSAQDGGGGFYNGAGAAVFVNSLLVHSPSGGDCGYQAGTVNIYYSLIESTGSGACGLPDLVNGTRVGLNPLLDDLRDNGGPTWTCALLPGSPAIDPVNSAACPAADQRGAPRPLDGNADGTAACDLGAYEAYAPSMTFRLTVTTTGTGSGLVMVQPASRVFSPMAVITLTAIPDLGSSFTGWSGDANGLDNPLTMIMLSGDKIITAYFAEIKRLYLPVVRR